MILRRVIQHVRRQEWTAIAIDFVIVVLGVFIGIQVANWNAARIERRLERDTLIRLHEDIAESAAGQDRDLRFYERQLADQSVILAIDMHDATQLFHLMPLRVDLLHLLEVIQWFLVVELRDVVKCFRRHNG